MSIDSPVGFISVSIQQSSRRLHLGIHRFIADVDDLEIFTFDAFELLDTSANRSSRSLGKKAIAGVLEWILVRLALNVSFSIQNLLPNLVTRQNDC